MACARLRRNVKAQAHDMSSMLQYIGRVKEVMADFEALLWDQLAEFEDLAQNNPTLLVDCLRVIELQVGVRVYFVLEV